MDQDKRRNIRIRKPLSVVYSPDLTGSVEKNWENGVIKDISEKGMCISTRGGLAPNKILSFIILIPFRPFEWFKCKGKVLSVQGPRDTLNKPVIGATHTSRIKFMDLQEGQMEIVKEYVNWFRAKYGGGE